MNGPHDLGGQMGFGPVRSRKTNRIFMPNGESGR